MHLLHPYKSILARKGDRLRKRGGAPGAMVEIDSSRETAKGCGKVISVETMERWQQEPVNRDEGQE